MGISTNITGDSGSSNQLFDLLAVVANPEVYKAKLSALENAAAENKKYLDAIGPASEIVALRDEAALAAKDAKDVLAQAKLQADKLRQDAIANATDLASNAKAKADALVADAAKIKDSADSVFAEAKAEIATAKAATESAKKAQVEAEAKAKELVEALSAAQTAKEEAQAVKADILAKHEAFIKGL
jgi:cell division septum initiation protein DivIVA